MKRAIWMGTALLLGAALEARLPALLSSAAHVDVLLIGLVAFATRLPVEPALLFAFGAGNLRDCLVGTPVGLHGFLFLGAALVVLGLRRVFFPRRVGTAFLGLLLALALVHGIWWLPLPGTAGPEHLQTAVLAVASRTLLWFWVLFWPFAQMAERLSSFERVEFGRASW